jgi:glycosyltransferase involved in cell wall biosynthesis
MGKLRLAVFNTQPPQLYFGGVERRIMETTKRLQAQADITVYSGTKAGFKKPKTINGVKFNPCYSTDSIFPLDNWLFNRSLIKKASNLDADIFEGHAVSGYGFPAKLEQLHIKKPFIHTVHGVLADEYEQAKTNGTQSMRDRIANTFMYRLANLEEQTAQNATLIVTISNYSLEKLQKYYNIDTSKVRIVPNGVDTEKFKPTNEFVAVKHNFGLGDEPCVLFVGSLISRKGLPFLIEAAKRVVKQKANTKFVIVGDGPLKNHLIDSLKSANLSENFVFLSKLNEETLVSLYNSVDVFALPSIQEGQGIVLLEAQACSKPVVAFDIGGVNEAVKNGETGLLVELGNTDAFAESLQKLLADRALRNNMGRAGRKFVTENYTWDLCAQRMLKIYNEALGN